MAVPTPDPTRSSYPVVGRTSGTAIFSIPKENISRMINAERADQLLASKMQPFPLCNKYLASSLTNRARHREWYENRVIRYILKDSPWISRLEVTFQEAQLDTKHNSDGIFSVLQGTELNYDEQLFDAMAEVRLCRWATQNGFASIEKLLAQSNHPTPDFRMNTESKVALAEAKHFRVRDYLVDFIADRLEGLALKTGGLREFVLQVETGSRYAQMRNSILTDRQTWIEKTRAELTEGTFSSLEQSLQRNSEAPIEIIDGLFTVERSTAGSGRVFPALIGILDPKATVELCLSKLKGELDKKLLQIRKFMETTDAKADQAIVFFTGIDQWEPEWAVLWDTLEGRGNWAWELVQSIKQDADKLIIMPFELIVGRNQGKGRGPSGEVQYGPIEYVPFSWQPESMSS